MNTSLMTGLPYGTGFAVMGTKLFVGTSFDTLGEYTTSGETVNAFLITGLQGPGEVEVSGSSLFIAHGLVDDIVIGKYKLDGTAVDPSLIFDPFGEGEFAVSGAALYLAQLNTLAKYTTSGELVTYPLIPPFGPSNSQQRTPEGGRKFAYASQHRSRKH